MHKHALLLALASLTLACTDSCVASETLISTPRGRVRVERLKVGDTLYSVDVESGELVEVTLTAVRHAVRECLLLELDGGEALSCTPNHPIYDPDSRSYRDAGDWVIGDATRVQRVIEGRVQTQTLAHRSVFAGLHEVFDLSVSGAHHNFIANGMVVHNKSYYDPSWTDTESGEPEYTEAWFDEFEEVDCAEPLPPGAMCLAIRGKQFYYPNTTGAFVNNSSGDVIDYDAPAEAGSPELLFYYPQNYVGAGDCDNAMLLRVDFPASERLLDTNCTYILDEVAPVPPAEVGGRFSGELKVTGQEGSWAFTLDWSGVPVSE